MNEITTTTKTELVPLATIAQLGQAANKAAQNGTFDRALSGKSENTRTSYKNDLATWTQFLADAGGDLTGLDFYKQPSSWAGVTHGLVLGFVEWMKQQGFAVASINRKLSCVRVFCAMASQAGVLSPNELALISTVRTIRHGHGLELDKQRDQTRYGKNKSKKGKTYARSKKAKSIELTAEQAKALKAQPDTPQGRRDALLMCLLLDHGLRAGEVAALTADNFNLKTGIVTFWRKKVKKEQKHQLTAATLTALHNYINAGDYTGIGPLLRSSLKSGELGKAGMSEHAVTMRVKKLGEKLSIVGLSAHDCRHYWATSAVKGGSDPFALRQAGGWSSMQTVQRYVSENEIANAGVTLGE